MDTAEGWAEERYGQGILDALLAMDVVDKDYAPLWPSIGCV